MPFHYRALASLWVIIFGLSTLSGSGTIVGPDVALLGPGGIVTPAVLLTAATWWHGSSALKRDARLAVADARDLMRMDSDKG